LIDDDRPPRTILFLRLRRANGVAILESGTPADDVCGQDRGKLPIHDAPTQLMFDL
jgi:hypothetical protein